MPAGRFFQYSGLSVHFVTLSSSRFLRPFETSRTGGTFPWVSLRERKGQAQRVKDPIKALEAAGVPDVPIHDVPDGAPRGERGGVVNCDAAHLGRIHHRPGHTGLLRHEGR